MTREGTVHLGGEGPVCSQRWEHADSPRILADLEAEWLGGTLELVTLPATSLVK